MDKITKGWIHQKYGYKVIRVNGKSVPEHRYIMEQHIGRKLKHDEQVHHIDGNRLNNTIENLQIMTRAEHARLHMKRVGFPKLSEEAEKRRRERNLEFLMNGRKKLPEPPRRSDEDIRKEHSEKMKLWWANHRKQSYANDVSCKTTSSI